MVIDKRFVDCWRTFPDCPSWVLDEFRQPIPKPNIVAAARWMEAVDSIAREGNWLIEEGGRHVGHDVIHGLLVSTVFLVFCSSFIDEPPLPFETMVLNQGAEENPWDGAQERYFTMEEARAGHARWVERVKNKITEWEDS